MPSRNSIKTYVEEGFYHIYNRGVNKRRIFVEEYDYSVFLNLLKRYLSREPIKDNLGRKYETLNGRIELLAYCLMPNHFHLLIFQKDAEAMTSLVRRVSLAYAMYFNKEHKRTGPLFQERFKASLISKDEYLQHISRYIHLNPEDYQHWEFSSLPNYLGAKKTNWVSPNRIMELFASREEYREFVADYKDHKEVLDEIKHELANSSEV